MFQFRISDSQEVDLNHPKTEQALVSYININKLPLDNIYNQFVKRTFDVAFSFLISIFFLSSSFQKIGVSLFCNFSVTQLID